MDYHPTSYQNAVEIHKTLNNIPKLIQDISGSYLFLGLISAHDLNTSKVDQNVFCNFVSFTFLLEIMENKEIL